jgi:hypothetical protein
MQPREITDLKEAIRAQCGCEALYVRTMHVNETLNGVTPWHGLMMVFELVGHPEAECCYAWNSRHDGRTETHVILQVPPVTTPASALQAAYEARAEQKESSAQTGSLEAERDATIL